MKYLSILLLFIGIKAKAQTDSSQLYLPIPIKAKYAAVFTPKSPVIEDYRLLDTLNKAMGSKTKPDTVATVNFKMATYASFIQNLLAEPTGAYYFFTYEFFTSTQAANGWSGYTEMVNYYKQFGTAAQKAAALWLDRQVQYVLGEHAKSLLADQVNGAARAEKKKTIIHN